MSQQKQWYEGKHSLEAVQSCSREDAPVAIVKQVCPDEPQMSSATAVSGDVKEEPTVVAEDMQREDSPVFIEKQECPPEPQMSSAVAGAGDVRGEPADAPEDMLQQEGAPVPIEQERPEEPQGSSAACSGDVKAEPPDAVSGMQRGYDVGMQSLQMLSSAGSDDETPTPLIDVVKCEPTLIQTLDDGLRPSKCSAIDSTVPSAEVLADVSPCGLKYNRHEQMNGREKLKIEYSCDDCNMKYINTKPNHYKCDECKKIYKRKAYLIKHMAKHTKLKKLQCEVCDKLFSRRSYFIRHIYWHSKLVTWKCDVCHTVLYNKSNLNTLTVRCTVCGTRAVSSSSCTK